ncbi:hypothetical protein [Micromonospora sp. NPDC002717]
MLDQHDALDHARIEVSPPPAVRLIGGNLVVLLLAGFVAYGRLGPWPM